MNELRLSSIMKSPNKKLPVTIHLDKSIHEFLKIYCARQEVHMGDVIAAAIHEYIQTHKEEIKEDFKRARATMVKLLGKY